MQQKRWKRRFQPAFGVHSTKTLVRNIQQMSIFALNFTYTYNITFICLTTTNPIRAAAECSWTISICLAGNCKKKTFLGCRPIWAKNISQVPIKIWNTWPKNTRLQEHLHFPENSIPKLILNYKEVNYV